MMSEPPATGHERAIPLGRPILLLLAAIVCALGVVVLSDTFFPNLGPSADRLTSDDPAVRRVAEITVLEIKLVRIKFLSELAN